MRIEKTQNNLNFRQLNITNGGEKFIQNLGLKDIRLLSAAGEKVKNTLHCDMFVTKNGFHYGQKEGALVKISGLLPKNSEVEDNVILVNCDNGTLQGKAVQLVYKTKERADAARKNLEYLSKNNFPGFAAEIVNKIDEQIHNISSEKPYDTALCEKINKDEFNSIYAELIEKYGEK